jgi:FMN reductase
MASLTVVGLGGSIATVSRSRAALQVALGGAAEAGAETKLLDLRELDLPMFNPEDDEPTPKRAECASTGQSKSGCLMTLVIPSPCLSCVRLPIFVAL